MRLIDADKLLERMRKGMESGSNLNGTFDLYIEHAPTESTNTPINTPTDLISKAKVLETYSELYWFDSDCEVVSKAEVDKIYERLQSLPSAEPKTGKWVEVEINEYEGFNIVNMRCNQCRKYAYLVLPKGTKCVYDYCPNCGAMMLGEDSDTE